MASIAFAEDVLKVSPSPVIAGSAPPSSRSSSTAAPTTHIPPTTSHSTSPPTNSTTIKPTTPPPSQPSTSTPAPEPSSTVSPPQKGHFMVPNDTCIIADFAIQVTVNMENNSFSFDLPTNATVNVSCSNTTDELNLSWIEDFEKTYSLSFLFKKNESTLKYMVSQISLVIPIQNVSVTFKMTEEKFETSVLKSYKCDKEQEIKLEEEPNTNNNSFAMLKISQVQLQAFHTSEDNKFSVAEDCAESSSTDIVPIAVGCALVVLIVIVLIAYLVGRRHSQNRGYLSM